ncbi:MAG TPA: ABC transporter permease [Chitinophagaceae bacterium]|jgi:putative ABC transport system permease protein|nr:ABC transporter permease [Chitinophagaceae bacterium]
MFRNYLITAWRNLVKNRTFSLINILGLAIGLCCFVLIAVYVLDELNFDRFHKKAGRIYRVNSEVKFGGTESFLPVASDAMGALLQKDYPQVEAFVRIYTFSGSKMIRKGAGFLQEHRIGYADSTFFDVFTFPVLAGDPATALDAPNSAVLSESAALKYFGTTEALGKVLETNDQGRTDYRVTAVMKDMPEQSHMQFDVLLSMDNVQYGWGNVLSHNFFTYLLLREGTDAQSFAPKLNEYIQRHVVPMAREVMQINSMEEFNRAGNKLEYTLQPLTDIHLRSHSTFELRPSGDMQYVYIFSAVAVFILLIACVNFMNLATARSANRAREVGVRKVLGTSRGNLIFQFLTESTLMALFSLILAAGLAALVLPYFNELSGKELDFADLLTGPVLAGLLLLPFVVGLLAGSYPAFYLSGFRPIHVLKGKLQMGSRRSLLRSTLVVFQFTTSIILIIGTIVIFRQLNYIQNKNLGFKKEQVLILDETYTLGNNTEAFLNEIKRLPGVLSASYSGYLPVSNSSRNDMSYSKGATMSASNGFNMQTWTIGYDYLKTLGMELVAGRSFSPQYGTDSSGIILNESAARLLGYTDPLNKQLYSVLEQETGSMRAYNVIGVVKNFHFESMKQNIAPLAFVLGDAHWAASVRIQTTDVTGLLAAIEERWKKLAPGMPFHHRFMDEAFDEMYRSEVRMSQIAAVFSVLAILVACLGLFGLATYMAEQRTKEIGIRKVLGADVGTIVRMLSADFLKLVCIAALVAFPLAGWAMHTWLQDFAYRVSLGWWIFLAAGLLTSGIALLTVSFQAVRAALMNPVRSLRSE